jgi:hypothetical protein
VGALNKIKGEILAQGLAAGLPVKQASREALYRRESPRRAIERAENPNTIQRVAEIEWQRAHEAADLSGIIEVMLRAANAALDLNSAAGFVATRGLLTEAAKLKLRMAEPMPPPPRPPPPIVEPPPQVSVTLSPEEWARQFLPRRHGVEENLD